MKQALDFVAYRSGNEVFLKVGHDGPACRKSSSINAACRAVTPYPTKAEATVFRASLWELCRTPSFGELRRVKSFEVLYHLQKGM